jgi:asparagine synthase (glutamine-hydrolysing)
MEWGESCLNKFRGMFAFCIYDKNKRNLFLSRDRFGIKPLLFSFFNEKFIFSSELKLFFNSKIIPIELSQESIEDYFYYGSVQQPKTIIKEVYQLMPGCSMNAKIYLRKTFEEATNYHMVADVKVGAFLSGGVDSTAVVAMMQHFSDTPINTYTVGFKEKNNVFDETNIANRTAQSLGTIHHDIKIDEKHIEDIFNNYISSLDQPSIE